MKKYDNLDMYIFSCGDLDTWKCPLLNAEQQTAVAKEFVKLYEQIEDKYPSVVYHLLIDPAAKTHHQNYEGGLTEHNFKFACYMYAKLIEEFNVAKSINILTSVVKVAVLHDLCKVCLYKWNETTKSFDYDYEKYKHHAITSLDRAQTALEIKLKQIERICILLHMGPWANEEDYCAITEEDTLFLGEEATDFRKIKNWNNRDDFDSMLRQIGWDTVESQIVLMAHWADMQACK